MNNKELLIVGNLARDLIFGREFFGGSAASIAVNFARLGGKPSLLSVLGRDDFSTRYRHFLQGEGVDMSILTAQLLEGTPLAVSRQRSFDEALDRLERFRNDYSNPIFERVQFLFKHFEAGYSYPVEYKGSYNR